MKKKCLNLPQKNSNLILRKHFDLKLIHSNLILHQYLVTKDSNLLFHFGINSYRFLSCPNWIFQYFQPTLPSGLLNSLHCHNNLPNPIAFSLNSSFFLCIDYKERYIFVLHGLLWRAPKKVGPISLLKPIGY